jgi:hypothetical protein
MCIPHRSTPPPSADEWTAVKRDVGEPNRCPRVQPAGVMVVSSDGYFGFKSAVISEN